MPFITQGKANIKYLLIVTSVAVVAGGVIFTNWSYFQKESVGLDNFSIIKKSNKKINTETTDWKEYLLEEITKDSNSLDFTDRRLVGIKNNGQRDIIAASVKVLMGWQKDTTSYPRKVSFPPYSQEIFFTKWFGETAHSGGFYGLNVETLIFKELTEIGKIYENYYNYQSIISPDGLKIAALGGEDLYLLDLLKNEAKVLIKSSSGEMFNTAGKLPDFIWLDNHTIQYPVYSAPLSSADQKPIEIRKISTNKDEATDWKNYRNEEYGFEIKYPKDWIYDQNVFSFKPNLVFCPLSLTEVKGGETVCKLKTGASKPQYEEGMIYLFSYGASNLPVSPPYNYLGVDSKSNHYYLFSELSDNKTTVDQMLSTFKLIESYTACGCGCCAGVEPTIKCLYHSKGDDIQKIINEDKNAAQSSICQEAGCSLPIKYTYCD